MNKIKFELGQLVETYGVHSACVKSPRFAEEVMNSLKRYLSCDWGNLCRDDKRLNDFAVKSGDDRILAKYETSISPIYIITECDRSCTTILFTHEY